MYNHLARRTLALQSIQCEHAEVFQSRAKGKLDLLVLFLSSLVRIKRQDRVNCLLHTLLCCFCELRCKFRGPGFAMCANVRRIMICMDHFSSKTILVGHSWHGMLGRSWHAFCSPDGDPGLGFSRIRPGSRAAASGCSWLGVFGLLTGHQKDTMEGFKR